MKQQQTANTKPKPRVSLVGEDDLRKMKEEEGRLFSKENRLWPLGLTGRIQPVKSKKFRFCRPSACHTSPMDSAAFPAVPTK